jgi:hypothetical protein
MHRLNTTQKSGKRGSSRGSVSDTAGSRIQVTMDSILNRDVSQFGRAKKLLGIRKITSKARWDFLAQLVRSLCISARVTDDVVDMISSFTNLRGLELISFPPEGGHAATAPDVHLPHLESLKLRGYVSAVLAQKFCSNGEHITHLDLEL